MLDTANRARTETVCRLSRLGLILANGNFRLYFDGELAPVSVALWNVIKDHAMLARSRWQQEGP